MTLQLLSSLSARAGLVLAFALALAVAPRAQSPVLVIDDFEDQNFDEYTFFTGGGDGSFAVAQAAGADGTAAALSFTVDPALYGGFAGFFRDLPGAPVDASGVEDPYIVFEAIPNGTFTFEIKHEVPGGGANGTIINALRFIDRDDAEGYRTYALPLSTFLLQQGTFDFTQIQNAVFAVVDAAATDAGSPAITLDEIRLVDGVGISNVAAGPSFDDADFSEGNGFFFYGGDLNATATTETPDGSANGVSFAIDGDDYGGFAGFGQTIPGAPVDASSTSALNFYYKSNGRADLEVNIQTEAASGDAQDQGRDVVQLYDTGGEYRAVSIPLEAFIQTGAEAPDFSDIYNIAMTFIGLVGDGNSDTDEFEVSIDGLGFGTANVTPVSNDLPPSLAEAPSAFPNPAAGPASVAFALAESGVVRVEVFDVLGRRVATLADGPQAAGPVRLGVPTETFAPGTYVVRVVTETGLASTVLTVVR